MKRNLAINAIILIGGLIIGYFAGSFFTERKMNKIIRKEKHLLAYSIWEKCLDYVEKSAAEKYHGLAYNSKGEKIKGEKGVFGEYLPVREAEEVAAFAAELLQEIEEKRWLESASFYENNDDYRIKNGRLYDKDGNEFFLLDGIGTIDLWKNTIRRDAEYIARDKERQRREDMINRVINAGAGNETYFDRNYNSNTPAIDTTGWGLPSILTETLEIKTDTMNE